MHSGHCANEPWQSYDLGQHYCTYDFFKQLPSALPQKVARWILPTM